MSEGEEIDNVLLNSIGDEVLEEWSRISDSKKEIHSLTDVLSALEKEMLKNAMRHCRTSREIANFLKISQPTVIRKLKKHNLSSTSIHK